MAMINCPECGKKISDQASNCPNCGYIINKSSEPAINVTVEGNKGGIKCPRCGSNDLQAVSDVKGKGASFWKLCCCGLLGLCGTGKTTTTHYWVCGKCGNKFKM